MGKSGMGSGRYEGELVGGPLDGETRASDSAWIRVDMTAKGGMQEYFGMGWQPITLKTGWYRWYGDKREFRWEGYIE